MKREWLWRLLLVAPALLARQATASSSTETDKEPGWGRIYLRNGLAPIQYFRDSFGGVMVPHEVEFYFPQSHLGCELLSFDEQESIQASNGSTVIVVDRGECTFETKSRVAQAIGAAGLVVVSTTEEVHGPAAVIEGDAEDEAALQITIPSVMIRHSAGKMLRAIAAREKVHGWLMPMVCQLHPYTCLPRSADEEKYISEATARGGMIHVESAGSEEETVGIGRYLASTFGGTLSTSKAFELMVVSDASQACADHDASPEQRSMVGKAAMITVGKEHCSVFEQVSSAQRAGAAVAIVTLPENETIMGHPTVADSWVAYNLTIASVSVSSATAASLQRLGREAAIRFSVDNQVADDWEQIRRLSLHTAWPVRTERREKLARSLMADLSIFQAPDRAAAVQALERQFLRIGGSPESWRRLSVEQPNAVKQQAAPGISGAKAGVGGGKAVKHEEL